MFCSRHYKDISDLQMLGCSIPFTFCSILSSCMIMLYKWSYYYVIDSRLIVQCRACILKQFGNPNRHPIWNYLVDLGNKTEDAEATKHKYSLLEIRQQESNRLKEKERERERKKEKDRFYMYVDRKKMITGRVVAEVIASTDDFHSNRFWC